MEPLFRMKRINSAISSQQLKRPLHPPESLKSNKKSSKKLRRKPPMRKLNDKDKPRLPRIRLPLMPFKRRHRRRLMSLPKQRQKLPPRPKLMPRHRLTQRLRLTPRHKLMPRRRLMLRLKLLPKHKQMPKLRRMPKHRLTLKRKLMQKPRRKQTPSLKPKLRNARGRKKPRRRLLH